MMKKIILLGLILMLIVPMAIAAEGEAVLTASSTTVNDDGTFTVTLKANPTAKTDGGIVQWNLKFNPALEVVSIDDSKHSLWNNGAILKSSKFDNTAKTIHYEFSILPGTILPRNEEPYMVITFKAINKGVLDLSAKVEFDGAVARNYIKTLDKTDLVNKLTPVTVTIKPKAAAKVEDCKVIGDEDSNNLADCKDPVCIGQRVIGFPDALCQAKETSCSDSADNDGDTLTDSKDSDCKPAVSCTANARSCKDATTQQQCNADGKSYTDTSCNAGTSCVTGKGCVAPICTPGNKICNTDGTLATCKADGTYAAGVACAAGSSCDNSGATAECKAKVVEVALNAVCAAGDTCVTGTSCTAGFCKLDNGQVCTDATKNSCASGECLGEVCGSEESPVKTLDDGNSCNENYQCTSGLCQRVDGGAICVANPGDGDSSNVDVNFKLELLIAKIAAIFSDSCEFADDPDFAQEKKNYCDKDFSDKLAQISGVAKALKEYFSGDYSTGTSGSSSGGSGGHLTVCKTVDDCQEDNLANPVCSPAGYCEEAPTCPSEAPGNYPSCACTSGTFNTMTNTCIPVDTKCDSDANCVGTAFPFCNNAGICTATQEESSESDGACTTDALCKKNNPAMNYCNLETRECQIENPNAGTGGNTLNSCTTTADCAGLATPFCNTQTKQCQATNPDSCTTNADCGAERTCDATTKLCV